MKKKIISAIWIIPLAIILGFQLYAGFNSQEELNEITQEAESVSAELDEVSTSSDNLQKELLELNDVNKGIEAEIKERETVFDAQFQATSKILNNASYTNVEEYQNRLEEISKYISNNDINAEMFDEYIDELKDIAEKVDTEEEAARLEAEAAAEAERKAAEARATKTVTPNPSASNDTATKAPTQSAQPQPKASTPNVQPPTQKAPTPASPPTPAPASGNWMGEFRAILNEFGGGHIRLVEYDGNCGGVISEACSSNGVIKVKKSAAAQPTSYKRFMMMHELAHQYQFRVWDQIQASPTYHSLLGGNIEKLANCMSAARGYPAPVTKCNQTEINWAAKIWNGVVEN